jgi:electron transfer flavoprotein beta subunit
MKVLVCVSHVPDTTSKIRFVNNFTEFDKSEIQYIIGPYDELALTRALELKDANKVTNVTVVNVGKADTEPTIRKALAIGADDAIRIDAEPTDAFFVAAQIAEVAKKGGYELIFVGKEAIDYNGAQVGDMIAEFMDIESVSASHIDIENGKILLEREIEGGKEKLEAVVPLLATGQKGFAIEPRIANMRGIMASKKKPLQVVAPVTVENMTVIVKHYEPQKRTACKMISADNPAELIRLLHEEAKVI